MRRGCSYDNSAEVIFISYTHELDNRANLSLMVLRPTVRSLFYRRAYGPLEKVISHHCCVPESLGFQTVHDGVIILYQLRPHRLCLHVCVCA